MRVFASVSRGNESSNVYDSIFVWVEDVKYDRFKACVVEGGRGAGDNFTIDWFAFQGPQIGAEHEAIWFGKFTTGSQCNRVTLKNVRCFDLVSEWFRCLACFTRYMKALVSNPQCLHLIIVSFFQYPTSSALLIAD